MKGHAIFLIGFMIHLMVGSFALQLVPQANATTDDVQALGKASISKEQVQSPKKREVAFETSDNLADIETSPLESNQPSLDYSKYLEEDRRRRRRATADMLLGRQLRIPSSSSGNVELTPEQVVELLAFYTSRNRAPQPDRSRWSIEENTIDEGNENDIGDVNDALTLGEARQRSRYFQNPRVQLIKRELL